MNIEDYAYRNCESKNIAIRKNSTSMKNYLKKIKNIPKRIEREIEAARYRSGKYANQLRILSSDDSLRYIEQHKISFYRYGDGEIAIMMGEGIPFQKADEQLAKRLTTLLKTKEKGIKAAIPYCYFHYEKGLVPAVEGFNYAMKVQRRFLISHCNRNQLYLDTSITQLYQSYETYDFEQYFARVKKLFCGRNVTMICGEGIFKNIQYNLLEQCDAVTYQEAPSKNAFSEYPAILARALNSPKDSLICIVLGPTAKPLAYDLHKQGYQAWDIGHFIKDYDAYCKKTSRDEDSIAAFYRPD